MSHASVVNSGFFIASVFVVSVIGSVVSSDAWSQTDAAIENAKPQASGAQFADSPIELETTTGKIFGSLMLPVKDAGTSLPLVLIHAGSGATDRDGNGVSSSTKNESLKMLAVGLAQNGVASIRYDKRGVAQSASAITAEKDLRFDHYVDDLAAWVSKMKADKRFSRVVIAGHSEGSLIGMIAAGKSKADGYISIAGIARGASDVLRTQLKPKLPGAMWDDSERILKSLEAGKTIDDPPAALAPLYRPSVQPYLISLISKKPADEIAKLNMPILVVQGTTDLQVAVSEAQGLKAAAPKAELAIFDGMNHMLKNAEMDRAKNIATYGDPALPLHAELVPRIVKFVEAIK